MNLEESEFDRILVSDNGRTTFPLLQVSVVLEAGCFQMLRRYGSIKVSKHQQTDM